MSKHWIHKLHELSLEQLEELIKEIGECAPLTKEFRIKLLMEKLPGLRRDISKVLVTTDRSTLSTTDEIADELAILFSQLKLVSTEVTDLRMHCSEEGKKTLERAYRRYTKHPMFRGRADLAETVLLKGLQEQVNAKETGKEYTDEQVHQEFESTADEFEEIMRLRDWLRDEYDIHERADYFMMMDAMRVVYEAHRERWQSSTREQLNALTKRARSLFVAARNYRCSPSALQEWRELKKKPLNPRAIYTRPDGVQIFGTGEVVIHTKHGPKRPVQTIFGKEMPKDSIPTMTEMEKIIDRAFPDDESKQDSEK